MVLSLTCNFLERGWVGVVQNKTAQRTDNELKSI